MVLMAEEDYEGLVETWDSSQRPVSSRGSVRPRPMSLRGASSPWKKSSVVSEAEPYRVVLSARAVKDAGSPVAQSTEKAWGGASLHRCCSPHSGKKLVGDLKGVLVPPAHAQGSNCLENRRRNQDHHRAARPKPYDV